MSNTGSEGKRFELGIWHPLALPAKKQDRIGYELLIGASWIYPSGASRIDRKQAINAVRALVADAKELLSKLPLEESDVLEVSGSLHVQLYISPFAASQTASAIAQAARRRGLVCYDPQNDILTLPMVVVSGQKNDSPGTTEPATTPDEEPTVTTFGPWIVRAQVETTRRCYVKVKESGSERCRCDNCSNFGQVRDQAYPPEVLNFFESVGIDFRKESEVHYYGKTTSRLHTYRGWFYFSGVIEHGPESWSCPSEGKPERRFHRIGPQFEVGLSRKSNYGFSDWETVLIDAGFADVPCIEVDFYVDLPWLSNAPQPDLPQS